MNNGDLISREALKKDMCKICNEEYSDEPCELSDCVFLNAIKNATAVDAVEVVRCEKCVLHGNCVTEDAFVLAGVENPFCCAGKRKEGAD